MNNLSLDKKMISGIAGILMITSALAIMSAGGILADERGDLTEVTVDPDTSNVGAGEQYVFSFVNEQRIIGTDTNDENIVIEQEDFDFSNLTVDDVAVVYWSEEIDQWRTRENEDEGFEVDGSDGKLNILLELGEDDNIAKDREIRVFLDEDVENVENPEWTGTYTFTITTYDGYNQDRGYGYPDGYQKTLDQGTVDVEIEYPEEVTAGSVKLETSASEDDLWFGTIQEAVNEAEPDGDNIVVYDNYDGEPEEGTLSLPITVDEEDLTIRAAEGDWPTVDATDSEAEAFEINEANVTLSGLEIIGAENNDVIVTGSDDLSVTESTIEMSNDSDDDIFGIDSTGILTVENSTILGGGNNDTMAVTTRGESEDTVIDGNVIKNVRTGIQTRGDDGVTVANNEFENIRARAFYATTAVDDVDVDYLVENNDFTDIGEGLDFNANTNEFSADVVVNQNNFENADANDGWSAVQVREDDPDGTAKFSGEVVAEMNWWNDPAGPLADGDDDGTIGDNISKDNLGDGAITPWLDAPWPDGEPVDSVEFDQDTYTGEDLVTVTARVGPLLGEEETFDVEVESEQTGESITLTLEDADEIGVFENSFRLTDNENRHGGENLYVENIDTILIEDEPTVSDYDLTEWVMEESTAEVDLLSPVVDNIVISETQDDSWVVEGDDNTWSENKIWARGDIEITANFTEDNPENIVFTVGDRDLSEDLEDGDTSTSIREYVSRIDDGTLPVTATVTDSGGLTGSLKENVIVDTTTPDVEVVKPETVGFGPNVDETTIPIQVDANDNVVDDVPGSGVETVTVDIPALENDIVLTLDEDTGYWENEITANVENLEEFEVTATAVDKVDLETEETATAEVDWDNTAPTIEDLEVTYPEGFEEAKAGESVKVTATVTDDVEVGSVVLNADNLDADDEIEMTEDGDEYSTEVDVGENLENGTFPVTVTADDTANNENTDSVGVDVVTYYTSFEIDLEDGWNLISLPIMPDNNEIESVLEPVQENVLSVWGYDASEQSWEVYQPGMPPEASDLDTMDDGYGYWVRMAENSESATLKVEGSETTPGEPESPPAYQLYEGWNLMGFKSVSEMPANEYMGEHVTDLTRNMYRYDESLNQLRSMSNTGTMVPGNGYWVYANEDVELVPQE